MRRSVLVLAVVLGTIAARPGVSWAWVQAPTADLKIPRNYVIVGHRAVLDGRDSVDPDDEIVKYEWDFNDVGNNVYNYWETADHHPDSRFDGLAFHRYDVAGTYTVKLRVTDGYPNTSTDPCTVTVCTDGDEDGLPNEWEETYLEGTGYDGEGDKDMDGHDNLKEYLHGSDPDDGDDEPVISTIIFVPQDVPTIERAIEVAIDGDVIMLAEGIYTGHNVNGITPGGKAITIQSMDPYDPEVVARTVVDCEADSANPRGGFYFQDGEDADTAILGLTIKNAYFSYGAGIYCCNDASPTIARCVVADCASTGRGPGILCYSASPTIIDCVISGNTTTGYSGGGLCNVDADPNVINCVFLGNSAPFGGAIENINSAPHIVNCLFHGNTAGYGGAMDNFEDPNVVGGVPATDVQVTNCIFWDNTADVNDQVNNDANATTTPEPSFAYCDIEGCGGSGGGWDAGLGTDGGENIDADPNFFDADDPDGPDAVWGTIDDGLRLRLGSPCLDTGDPDTDTDLVGDLDVGGDQRVRNGTYGDSTAVIDMGPYEQPRVWFVDADAGSGGDGQSWAEAFNSLQDALTEPDVDAGDEIWVAQGTYDPDGGGADRTKSFVLIEAVGLYGGFQGAETGRWQRDWTLYRTILSGDLNGNGLADSNDSYHVVEANDAAVLDGFVITCGKADGQSPDDKGAGLYSDGHDLTLRHCTITGCQATYAAVYLNDGDGAVVEDCTFADNSATMAGGLHLTDSDALVRNCVFVDNSAGFGGALYSNGSSPCMVNCTVASNTATLYGGGYIVDGGGSACEPRLTNCIFWGNTAAGYPQIYDSASRCVVAYSNVEDGWTGTGNIDSDPGFIDADNPDGNDGVFGTWDDGLRLASESPCVDTADGDAGRRIDMVGLVRLDMDGVANTGAGEPDYADMGARESYDGIDSDGDDMPDDYELLNGLDPDNANDALWDIDGDGLTSLEEFAAGTRANGFDTDGDGMDDGWEARYGLNPLDPSDADEDPDGDGQTNLEEYLAGTNPNVYTTIAVTEFQYNNAGDVVRETTRNAQDVAVAVTEYQYDELGRRWHERRWADADNADDVNDVITITVFDTLGNVAKTVRKADTTSPDPDAIEADDVITRHYYDSLGRLTDVNDPEGGNTHYSYYAGGQIQEVNDPNGNLTTYTYDDAGRLVEVTDAEGHYRQYAYDSLGHKIRETAFDNGDIALLQTRFEYDNVGHLIQRAIMADADSTAAVSTSVDRVVDFDYPDSTGLPADETRYYGGGQAATTVYGYDGLGRQTTITDPCNNVTTLTYDAAGRVITRQQVDDDPLGSNDITLTTEYVYDTLGRVHLQIAELDPQDPDTWQTTEFIYDAAGNRIWEIAPDGMETGYAYDALGRLTVKVADYGGIEQTTVYGYDRLGRQTSITGYADGSTAQTTVYTYDGLDRVTAVVYPDGNDIRYAYNAAGKVVERIDQRGIVTSYCYDGNYNMLSKIVDSNGAPTDDAAETFTYDGLGRMLSADKTVNGGNVSEVDFVYDESGRLYTETQKLFAWNARTVTYAYTQSAEPTNITYPSTASVGITRDWQDRIDTMTLGGYSYVEYQYIGSRVAKRTYPKPTNDIIYQPSYDNLGRITSAYTYVDGGSTVAKFDYTYDPNTNSITQQEYDHRDGDPVSAFTYDALRRLTDVDYGIDDTAESFDLDKLGNRDDVDTRYAGQVDYAIDELTNRYDTVGGNALTYDAAGNLTTDRQGYSYEYDYENRITKILKAGPVTVAEYSYDALGRRVEKKDSVTSTNTRRYYYDKDWRVLDDYDGSGTLKRRYMCGNYIDEVLFSWLAPGATYRYYVHDHLHSTVALLGYDSTVLERYEYDAYGEPNILDGSYTPRATQASAYDNTYMFTGRQVDILDGGALRIQYNRNRYYDYYTGRWTTQDPLGYVDGVNLYLYTKAVPTFLLDPYGLWHCRKDDECTLGDTGYKIIDRIVVIAFRGPNHRAVLDSSLIGDWGLPMVDAARVIGGILIGMPAETIAIDALPLVAEVGLQVGVVGRIRRHLRSLMRDLYRTEGFASYLKVHLKECKKDYGFLWLCYSHRWHWGDVRYYRCRDGCDYIADHYSTVLRAAEHIDDCEDTLSEDFNDAKDAPGKLAELWE